MVSEELFTEPLVLAVGEQHELHGHGTIRIERLAGMPLILRPAGTPSRKLVENCFAARGLTPTIVIEMSSGEATLATIRCSRLATICAGRALDGAPGIARVRIDAPELRRSGAILWHRDRHRSNAAVIFSQMARRAYAAAEARPPRP